MSVANAVMSVGTPGPTQGYGELTVLVIAGVLLIAFLVVGVVTKRRGGKAAVWFALSALALVVGVLTVSLS